MSKAKVAVPIKKAVPAPQIKAKAVIKKKDDDEAYTTKCGKPQKEKDPNAPKRPQSSYFLFMNDRRPQL